MEKHCGKLERIGTLTGGEIVRPVDKDGNQYWVGSYRSASEVDAIQIGGTVLRKPRCEDTLFQALQPGRDACLYVWRHGRTPVLLGVKYPDGTKHLITSTYRRGTILQLATIFAFMYWLGGAFLGGMLAGVMGLGQSGGVLVMLVGALTGGWCWWQAYQFWQDCSAARAD